MMFPTEPIPGPWPNGGAFKDSSFTEEEARSFVGHKDFEFTESFFIQLVQKPRSHHDVYWSVIALREVGTSASIPVLKRLCDHSYVKALCNRGMMDITACALLTIASIAGQSETDFYIRALSEKWYLDKHYAIWAIEATADLRALDAILAWIKQKRSKIRSGKMNAQTAQILALYLFRLAPFSEIAFQTLKEYGPTIWQICALRGQTTYIGYEPFLAYLKHLHDEEFSKGFVD